MHWPFVSRARYELLQHNAEKMREAIHEKDNGLIVLRGINEACHRAHEDDRTRYDALLDKYHALRVNGADPAPPMPVAPEPPFGPLTRAALHDMGVGQSGILKRAMTAKTQVIWLEHRGNENQDELTAIAVRQGEVR